MAAVNDERLACMRRAAVGFPMMEEAIAEIYRLKAELAERERQVARLREACEMLDLDDDETVYAVGTYSSDAIRAALAACEPKGAKP